jgi:dihydrodipicolinate synthase/N-acetylneuraminate lyase
MEAMEAGARSTPVRGLFAALVTPVRDSGRPDVDRLDRILDAVLAAGVDGVCVGGATGEYPHVEAADRVALLRHVAGRLPRGRMLLAGVGASSLSLTLEIGRAAIEAGSLAVLLPMPWFYKYGQDDLASYCLHVSEALRTPCLLYDLPAFTNALETSTLIHLLRTGPYLAGVKDSSGDRARLAGLSAARDGAPWSLVVGDDRLVSDGLRAGWDGSVSGIAASCPELLAALVRSLRAGEGAEGDRLQRLVDDVAARLAPFPVPWGVRIALEARGHPTGPLPLPLTAERRRQAADFTTWLRGLVQAEGW